MIHSCWARSMRRKAQFISKRFSADFSIDGRFGGHTVPGPSKMAFLWLFHKLPVTWSREFKSRSPIDRWRMCRRFFTLHRAIPVSLAWYMHASRSPSSSWVRCRGEEYNLSEVPEGTDDKRAMLSPALWLWDSQSGSHNKILRRIAAVQVIKNNLLLKIIRGERWTKVISQKSEK